MKLRPAALLLLSLTSLGLFCAFISGHRQVDKSEIFVQGQVYYNNSDPLYQGLRVRCKVFEDGKLYKSFSCDDKGKFQTSVGIDHTYMFHFSMDYHGTTKVQVSTHLPPEKSKGEVGGVFKFKCEIFERVEGLSLTILRKPIIKIRYVPEKDKFEPDKEYTERILWELESFKEALYTLKSRGHKVLKDEPPKNKQETIAKAEPKKSTGSTKKVAPEKDPNPRGHRNILDNLKEEGSKQEVSSADQNENMQDAPIARANEEEETAISSPEDEVLDTAGSNSGQTAMLQIYPKREKITNNSRSFAEKKIAVRRSAISVRSEHEEKIIPQMTARAALEVREDSIQLTNKYIQSLRLQGIIRTVASEDKTEKMKVQSKKPILEFEVLPLITKRVDEGIFKSSETIFVSFPTKRHVYLKESYWFGLEYYYRDNEEVTYETFCKEITHYDKTNTICSVQ